MMNKITLAKQRRKSVGLLSFMNNAIISKSSLKNALASKVSNIVSTFRVKYKIK